MRNIVSYLCEEGEGMLVGGAREAESLTMPSKAGYDGPSIASCSFCARNRLCELPESQETLVRKMVIHGLHIKAQAVGNE